MAEKTRFELVLRYKRTNPLAGGPLEPLGYFSKTINLTLNNSNTKSSGCQPNFIKKFNIFFNIIKKNVIKSQKVALQNKSCLI